MYLKETDDHLATACMVPTVQKVVSNVVPDMAVIEGHERSEDISKWAMREANGGTQKPIYRSNVRAGYFSGGAGGVARMQISQVVALFIERWDELDSLSRKEILRRLE